MNNSSGSTVLMIKPIRFGFNEQTAITNSFQSKDVNKQQLIQENALAEFNNMVDLLERNKINVIVVNDTREPHTPDSIFPNNWISFHENGNVVLYPMLTENRRSERRADILESLKQKFTITDVIDLTDNEKKGTILEGTGSLVLDYQNKLAYACLSARTDKTLTEQWCAKTNFTSVFFTAVDVNDKPIYHTNVVMCVAEKFCVICLESIKDSEERTLVVDSLTKNNIEIIDITYKQMNSFAGNMYELTNSLGEKKLLMSEQAYKSLTEQQIKNIHKYASVINSPLYTIETNGGGSARCMIADIRLPIK